MYIREHDIRLEPLEYPPEPHPRPWLEERKYSVEFFRPLAGKPGQRYWLRIWHGRQPDRATALIAMVQSRLTLRGYRVYVKRTDYHTTLTLDHDGTPLVVSRVAAETLKASRECRRIYHANQNTLKGVA